MSPDGLSDAELLVREGIEASSAGDHARALDLLSLALTLDEDHVRGWLWLSGEVERPEDKAYCLWRVAALDPDNQLASQAQPREQRLLRSLREAVGEEAIPNAAHKIEETGETWLERIADRGAQEQPPPVPAEPAKGLRLVLRHEFALIAGLGLLLLALIALDMEGLPAPLRLLRLLLGLVFVLFVPGYALQAALFPRNDAPAPGSGQGLDGPERLALSFALSVAVVPPLALLLDRLPWGIRLWPIVIAEGLVIAILSTVALIRRRRLPAHARPLLDIDLDAKGWWGAQDRSGRVLYGVLAGALLLATVSAAAVILLPKSSEQFTEFYVLGPEGLAEDYPREAAPGQELSVTAGIANHEGQAAEFRIEVETEGERIGAAGPVTLADGEVWEAPVSYALLRAGADQQVEFLLYRDGEQEPYRYLRLWIDAVELSGGGDE